MNRRIYSWALYDTATSAFATVVIAGFFPIFFKQYWAADMAATESTFLLGSANSLSSLIVAVVAPFLGAIADRGGTRKRLLYFFAVIGIATTAALHFVARGDYASAATIYVVCTVTYNSSLLFYDSLIVNVATEDRFDRVSALGYALGYLGGGLLFAVLVAMVLLPQKFGFSDAAQVVSLSFPVAAVWWAIFSIPLLLFVHEIRPAVPVSAWRAITGGLSQLHATFQDLRRLHVIVLFLFAYWCYIDGVGTVIRMAIDYGLALGFKSSDLITALLITQFVGFPSAIAFGRIGERFGPKTGIMIAIGVYCFITAWGAFISAVYEFYILAIVVGLVQGGVQSLSRSLYARLIPPEKTAEFFGFYNMLGKFAAVIGPFLMGWVAHLTGSSRISILAILALFIVGATLLYFVDVGKGIALRRGL
jgi:UMF1 family MFS transporter